MSNISLQVPALPHDNKLTATSLELPAGLKSDEWEAIGLATGRLGYSIQWWLGDWWAFGEHKYGDRRALVEGPDWTGYRFQACADCAYVCRKFETSRRREVLTFAHHRNVAGLPKVEADRLLDWCEATIAETGQPRTIRELREERDRRHKLEPGIETHQLPKRTVSNAKRQAANKNHKSPPLRVTEPKLMPLPATAAAALGPAASPPQGKLARPSAEDLTASRVLTGLQWFVDGITKTITPETAVRSAKGLEPHQMRRLCHEATVWLTAFLDLLGHSR